MSQAGNIPIRMENLPSHLHPTEKSSMATILTVKEGDVVLWEHGNNQRTLATVIEIYPKPSNTVKIRFSATQEPKDVRIRSLKVLVPSDSVENECLGSNKVDDMTEEISRAVESAEKKVV